MRPDIHVLPENDLREHAEKRDCWCAPRLERDFLDDEPDADLVVLVIHHSADGRELIEQHGVN